MSVDEQLAFEAIHLPSSDVAASRAFYVDVVGGEPIAGDERGARVRFGDFDIVVAPQDGGGTPVGAEYPHIAFTVTPEQFVGLKRRLDAYRVPTNEPWTRANRDYALVYFRDPSGNQFELFSPRGGGGLPLRIGARAGGDYTIDFNALSYALLHPPASDAAAPAVRPTGFNHLTMPCRDLPEAKSFLVDVLGGVVTYEARTHVTAAIGGAEVGVAPQRGGWTGADARFPHYAFRAGVATLRGMRERLASFGVPTALAAEGTDGLLYFRDPSGNLWKFVCHSAPVALLAAADAPSDARVDVGALNYDRWLIPSRS